MLDPSVAGDRDRNGVVRREGMADDPDVDHVRLQLRGRPSRHHQVGGDVPEQACGDDGQDGLAVEIDAHRLPPGPRQRP